MVYTNIEDMRADIIDSIEKSLVIEFGTKMTKDTVNHTGLMIKDYIKIKIDTNKLRSELKINNSTDIELIN